LYNFQGDWLIFNDNELGSHYREKNSITCLVSLWWKSTMY